MYKKNLTIDETFALAFQKHQKNNLRVAENLYKKILKTNSDHIESIFLLGTLSIQIRNFDLAIKLLNKVIKIQPNHTGAYHNLGLLFTQLKEFQKAKDYCQKAIQMQPNHIEAHYNLGNIFSELREFSKAVNCYQKVIQINPSHVGVHNNLGNVMKELRKFSKAVNCYQKAIQINPNNSNAHYNLGLLFKILGEFPKAIRFYQKALKYESENLITLYDLSNLKKEILNLNTKNKINKIIKKVGCTKKNLAYGNFILAKYELKKKNYEKEFNYLLKGHKYYFESENKKFKKEVNYWLNELPNVKELFNINNPYGNIKKIDYKIKPIFIIGFPRCGSTLVEKVIASSNKYIPIGEETHVLTNFIGQQINQKKLISFDLVNFQTTIFRSYERRGLIQEKGNYTFTDKTLDNFFYINIIKKIFPQAKVINCNRDPLSSIMSVVKNNLRDLSWAHNLEHMFEFFNNYLNIIKKFKKIYPNFIYELQYEHFVSNPEIEAKKLVQFCNLPWNKKCLEFYKRKDLISQTASNVQIRKAVYKDAIKKYLPYKKFLNKYGDKYHWFN